MQRLQTCPYEFDPNTCSAMRCQCVPEGFPLYEWRTEIGVFNFVWPLVAFLVAFRLYRSGRVHAASLWGAYAAFGFVWCRFGADIVKKLGATMG